MKLGHLILPQTKEKHTVLFNCIQTHRYILNMPRVGRKAKSKRKSNKKRRQYDGFLNRYDFAYAGRDVVKVALAVIKDASSQINNITQQYINQAIAEGGKELERVLLKILRGAIEDVYQTPFRLLGNFGKKQLNNLKQKLS